MTEWSMQDAKNRFSAVVNAALAGEPQQVTRRGQPAVVVIAVEEYERLRRTEPAAAPNLIEENPIEEPRPARPTPDGGALHVPIRPENKTGVPDFIDYLLAIPKGGPDDLFELPPRIKDYHPRQIDF